jgi:NAD(P)-dependent dehydrogenase (short-subunit alcohol dehydrogenase family)
MSLSGKTCLITGGTGAVGKAAAIQLSKLGAGVVLVARNRERGQAAQHEVEGQTGNKSIDFLTGDLSVQKSVRQLASDILSNHDQLHVLVNTAAVFINHRTLTPEGLEMMFATNHLGPFLLTNLLLDRLKAAGPARIITLSAPSTIRLDFDDLQGEKHFSALGAFGASKTANLLFTYELARRLNETRVTANVLHPGLIRSNLMQDAPMIIRVLSKIVSRSPERAGRLVAFLAASPEVEGTTGQFFKGTKISQSSSYSRDSENQKKLWDVSAKLTGVFD